MRSFVNITKLGVLTCGILFCLLFRQGSLITIYAAPDWPVPEPTIEASAGIVIDADSGAVLYEKDADTLYPPASVTKILTALIVMEHCEDLDDTVSFSKTAIETVEPDSGNKISVVEGDKMTVEDCLYAMLLVSSNQSANALAEYTAGSIDAFVEMMNDKVAELGLTSSHFENPSGLNGDTQNVTARELAQIARAAYSNGKLLEISGTISYHLPAMINNPEGLTIRNEHRLVYTTDESSEFYFPDAKAGKTGYLLKAGNTLVTYAEQDGKHLISVILKGKPRQYFVDAKTIMAFGFLNFQNYNISEYDSDFSDSELNSLTEQGLNPSELSISDDSFVTLPNDVNLSMAERILVSDFPARHPQNAVAMFEYTYAGRIVGTAFINRIQADPAAAAVPERTKTEDTNELVPASGSSSKLNPLTLIGTILLIILIAIIGAVIVFYIHSSRRETQMMEERRRKRKIRLKEAGISQDEFDQLLASRKTGRR